MHKTSLFGIKIDLDYSRGSYLYDRTTQREILDLFGMYSSLPLGYAHPVFETPEFKKAALQHAAVKIPNCEMRSGAAEQFYAAFAFHQSMTAFKHFHFCCTGALAVEAAIKTAMVATGRQRVLTLSRAFHGIYGYSGLLADQHGPAALRVIGLPRANFGVELGQTDIGNLAAVVIEPILCTSGDEVLPTPDLQHLRQLCDRTGAVLIFDEVQTGFGSTGAMWRWEQVGVVPDIVVFGKKTQVSGIMVREEFGKIFKTPGMLECTFDGDVLDMIRCRAILGSYAQDKILDNVREREQQFVRGLANVRHEGLLLALDFETQTQRDVFLRTLWLDHGTIVIPTGKQCVRLRPNLAITEAEVDDAITRLSYALEEAVAA